MRSYAGDAALIRLEDVVRQLADRVARRVRVPVPDLTTRFLEVTCKDLVDGSSNLSLLDM